MLCSCPKYRMYILRIGKYIQYVLFSGFRVSCRDLDRPHQTRPKPGPARPVGYPWAGRDLNDPTHGAYIIGPGFFITYRISEMARQARWPLSRELRVQLDFRHNATTNWLSINRARRSNSSST